MSASSTVNPHMKIPGISAARAPAISHFPRCPRNGIDVEKYVHCLSGSYDSFLAALFRGSPERPTDRMRFEIVVAPRPSDTRASPLAEAPHPTPSLRALRPERRRPARALLDVFIDGANVTARVRETHGAFVLRDLAAALVDLAARPRGKASVHFYDEP